MPTSMLIHDLKSPIAALDTLFYSLADRLYKEEIDLAQVSITKIKDKFKLLRQGPNEEKEWVDIVKLIQETIAEKKVLYTGRKISLNFQQRSTFFNKLYIEPLQFKRIISNLIENAKEAMPQGGNIVLRLSIEKNSVRIQVRDNGEGMDPHVLKLVKSVGGTFNKKDGTGHGLKHAKNVVQGWGGELEVDSLQGIGSIVTITIPYLPNSKPINSSGITDRPRLNVV